MPHLHEIRPLIYPVCGVFHKQCVEWVVFSVAIRMRHQGDQSGCSQSV